MTPLQSSSGFSVSQPVRILVPTTGTDANGTPLSFDAGVIGAVSAISDIGGGQSITFTVAVDGAVLDAIDTSCQPIHSSLEALALDGAAIRNVETYISAAEKHGSFEDPDHEVGDLQQLLRAAFSMLTAEQRTAFFLNHDVRAVLESADVID